MPSDEFSDLDDDALVQLWGRSMAELRRRGVVRTFNNPAGDLGERAAASHLGLTIVERNSEKGHDALDAEGRRYQVKTRRTTPQNKSRQVGISGLDDDPFDFLVGVIFDETFVLQEIWLMPPDVVREYARTSHRGHILRIGGAVLDDRRTRRVYPP